MAPRLIAACAALPGSLALRPLPPRAACAAWPLPEPCLRALPAPGLPPPAASAFWNAPPCKPVCEEASSIREKPAGSHPR